ncbi:hypothetical protein MCOR27_003123 [Pyricularia oryzae]|nr:hypothetical protein MCOR19_008592 [Pyricularia oryzae]KAI6283763.1 hypothetical protein MCOR27_003123 [Pyricularia oryzae]KAI6314740.1 hypothetical protein MCOR29_007273 [Pyricularia oryzae]KAI6396497.1 hypothetical protein MCOR24_009136 [Pyricularia oryzae]KAI6401301.1 hypothetical protein MCOR20_008122 [Pyricularia oryzae]
MQSPLGGAAPQGTRLATAAELDKRSDDEIIAMLTGSIDPPCNEKNMWAYWHTGFEAMPAWNKRNVVNWVRLLGPSWTVRVLDGVPGSAHNATKLVPPSMLPPAMNAGTMSGPYIGTHSADFVRLPLLFLYGGCWLDVGAILLRPLDDIWALLEDGTQPYEFAAFTYETRPGETSIINTWMMARKGNEMIRRWHDTFLHVWGDATSCDVWSHYGDYGAQVHCLERLRDLVDSQDGWDGRACIDRTAFLLPALKEMWYYQERTEFMGYKQFDLLTTKLDAADPQRAQAETFVNDMLANTLMMEFCHGLKGAMASSLADLWDDPANQDADHRQGTFAEYLRWGSVHLRQTRSLVPEKLSPTTNKQHRAAIFEPFPVSST